MDGVIFVMMLGMVIMKLMSFVISWDTQELYGTIELD